MDAIADIHAESDGHSRIDVHAYTDRYRDSRPIQHTDAYANAECDTDSTSAPDAHRHRRPVCRGL